MIIVVTMIVVNCSIASMLVMFVIVAFRFMSVCMHLLVNAFI